MLPHGFRPPEAHPPAGHPPAVHPPQAFAGARPTVPMSPQPARTTLRDGTPSAHAPRAPAPRERPSRDEPAFTPGPVTGPRIEARPTFQRARGLAFVAGLLVIGGVAAGSFVVRLRAAHAATCTKGIVAFGNTVREGSRTVAEMGDAPSMPVAIGTQDVVTTQRASPSSNAIPSVPAQGAAPSTRLPVATPTAQPVAPKGTAPARPAPAASASSEIFDTWK